MASVHPAESLPARPVGRVRRYATLLPLTLLLLLWLWVFAAEGAFTGGPNGKSFEADFAMFDAAAQIVSTGGNPYDRSLLYDTEKRTLDAARLPITHSRAIVRVGNPPLFFWALQPLTRIPFQPAALLWGLCMYLVLALGGLALLAHLEWRAKFVPLLLMLAMPQMLLAAFYGNPVPVVFAGISLALASARRFPWLAGALLTTAWLKPQLALPLVGVILLFQVRSRLRVAAGFAATSSFLLLVTLILLGAPAVGAWISALGAYSRDIATSPDISSLSGLYARVASAEVRAVLGALTLAAAAALTVTAWVSMGRRPRGSLVVGCLWVIWFLAAPYAHFYDEILLAFPLLVLLGRDAVRLTRGASILALYAAFLSLGVFQAAIGGAQPLCLFLLPVLWGFVATALSTRKATAPPRRRQGIAEGMTSG